MAQTPQSFKNHVRFDPVFHGFLVPGALLLLGAAIYAMVLQPNWWAVVRVLGGLWALVLMFKMRLYSLRVQDRVIRLEERLRLVQLLPESTRGRIGELNESQLIAMRFSADSEVASLVQQTLDGNWSSKQIKMAVKNWRPDYFRV